MSSTFLTRRRLITALFALCVIGGALGGAHYLPEDMSLLRRVLGGAVGGAGVALLVAATKMIG